LSSLWVIGIIYCMVQWLEMLEVLMVLFVEALYLVITRKGSHLRRLSMSRRMINTVWWKLTRISKASEALSNNKQSFTTPKPHRESLAFWLWRCKSQAPKVQNQILDPIIMHHYSSLYLDYYYKTRQHIQQYNKVWALLLVVMV